VNDNGSIALSFFGLIGDEGADGNNEDDANSEDSRGLMRGLLLVSAIELISLDDYK
jgi:hypothetical protein